MKKLPKWIKQPKCYPCFGLECKQYKALAIAWEALEDTKNQVIQAGYRTDTKELGAFTEIADEAISRIEELGAEEGKERR